MLAAGEPRLGNNCNDWIQGAARAIGLPSNVFPPYLCGNQRLLELYNALKAWDKPPSANVGQAATEFCLASGFCASDVSPDRFNPEKEFELRDPLP